MKAISRLSICLMLVLSIFTAIGNAQVLYGTLTGNVTDATGSVVPGAQVVAKNTQTGIQSTTESNAAGNYTFNNIQPGIYNVTATAQGFRTVSFEGVTIILNSVRRQNFELQIGQVTEQLTVEASAVTLQTEKTDVSASLSSQEMTNLPLPAFRNFQSLLDLVPGTSPAAFQNSVTDSPARSMTTNVNGTARNMNTMRVDGAVNVFVWLPHHAAYIPPAETVETVNISTNNFDAEQGMAGGAAVTVGTKSGTNEFHGVAFHYHDNQHLFARNYFLQPTQDKPVTINNIYGGTFGGPIIKNKWFFFGGYEANRQRLGGNLLATVATPEFRQGNFSGIAGTNIATTIYDPATGNADGSGRTQFANNIIPTARISSISAAAQALVPGANLGGFANNFTAAGNRKFDRHNYDIKSDYNVNESWRLWGKYSQMNALVTARPAFGAGIGPGIAGDPGTGDTKVQLVTVGTTGSITPTMLFDANFGWTGMDQDVTAIDQGQDVGKALGIPGTNDQHGSDVRYSGTPAFNVNSFTSWGLTGTWMPMWRNDHSFAANSNLGWTKGSHNIRIGMDIVKFHLNHWQPEQANPRGSFDFAQALTGNRTAAGGVTATTLANSYAGYLLGIQSSNSKSLQYEELRGREWQTGFYIRDSWQVNNRLTATMGLRYEFYPLINRGELGIEYYDPTTNMMERGGVGNVPKNAGISVSKKLFAPRLGLAYKVTDKTVVRAGYGITYNPIPLSRPLRGFYPYAIAQTIPAQNPVLGNGLTLANGIPTFDGPPRDQGVIPVPLNVQIRNVWAPEGSRELTRGYIQSWNFMIEREMKSGLVAQVGYVGTKTVHSFLDWEARWSKPGTGPNGSELFQKFGRNASTLLWNGWGDTQYHALQASLNGQVARGAIIRASYTWSKAMNLADDDGWQGVTWNDPSMIARNWAMAGFDRTHNFQIGGSWELPFGKGKSFLQEGFASTLAGGWHLNGLLSVYSGTPMTIGASSDSLNVAGGGQTADQVKDNVEITKNVGRGEFWFDRTAYRTITDVRYGNTGRNSLRGPGAFNNSLSAFRDFALNERFTLQFKAESFNFTNTPVFANPSANVNNADFGTISATRSNTGSPTERNIRFGLRLSF